jgi:hypothetical protein
MPPGDCYRSEAKAIIGNAYSGDGLPWKSKDNFDPVFNH